jgi:hypothetical protein
MLGALSGPRNCRRFRGPSISHSGRGVLSSGAWRRTPALSDFCHVPKSNFCVQCEEIGKVQRRKQPRKTLPRQVSILSSVIRARLIGVPGDIGVPGERFLFAGVTKGLRRWGDLSRAEGRSRLRALAPEG